LEEITLEQLLKAREDRALKQKILIQKYGLPLVSFTVNMPGNIKNTPLVRKIFKEGCDELEISLAEAGRAPVFFEACDLATGPEAYLVVDMEESRLKELTVKIEDGHPIGRLWDMDVIGRDGRAFSRKDLGCPERKCLICEKDAHACARSSVHSFEELSGRIQFIAGGYFEKKYVDGLCQTISQYAATSLLYEVSSAPKPGLVDCLNQGAHRDMDFFSFMRSSAALFPYFYKCASMGVKFYQDSPQNLFKKLRRVGLEAEKAMYAATGGANTHKGLIFSMGLLCAASALCYMRDRPNIPNVEAICRTVSDMTQGLCHKELYSVKEKRNLTHGEKMFLKYGAKGIRGEAESGFATVRACSLPVFKKLKAMKEYSLNDILIQTLLNLMAVNEDTNILARHGMDTLKYVRDYAARALDAGGMLSTEGRQMVFEMDREFIEINISPGGSADLLAVTIMLDFLSSEMPHIVL